MLTWEHEFGYYGNIISLNRIIYIMEAKVIACFKEQFTSISLIIYTNTISASKNMLQ